MKEKFKSSFSRVIIFSFTILIITSCEKEELSSISLNSSVQHLEKSSATSSVEIDTSGNVKRLSLVIPEAVLENMGQNKPILHIPFQSESANSPFNHLSLKWNPGNGIFSSPHIEVGFHKTNMGERTETKIEDPLNNVFPNAQLLPVNFIPAKEFVAVAGKRWINPSARELHQAEESHTFMFDTYNGEIISFVPAFTIEYLHKSKDQIFTLSLPRGEVRKTGYTYPSSYSLSYEAAKREYLISLNI